MLNKWDATYFPGECMDIDLSRLFSLDIPILEIIIRGSIMYLGVFTLLRVILKREVGSVGIPDLLMITFIADAAQNGMAGQYQSITGGLILVLTLVFWNFILDWISYRFSWFEKLTRAKPVLLVHRGRLQVQNMRLVSISFNELLAHLRMEGVEKIDQVKAAYLEGDGRFSVIRK